MLARLASCALAALAPVGAAHAGSGWSNTFPPGNGLNGTVRALLSFDDGSGPALFVGGDFTTAGGVPANYIAKWNGSNWSTVGLGVNGPVHALVIFDDGSGPALHVGGDFTQAGGIPVNRLAKWDGGTWSHLWSWSDELVRTLAVADVAGSGPKLYAGGPTGVARFTGTSWTPLPTSPAFLDVAALAAFDSGTGEMLYAGRLEPAGGGGFVWRWNGSSWSSAASVDYAIFALMPFDDGGGLQLYAAGGGPTVRWSGSTWTTLAGAPGARAFAIHDDGSGPAIYAGGTISLRRWEGAGWSDLGEGISGGAVLAMASFDDGTGAALYVAGEFTTAGGVPAERIARWCCGPPASIAFCPGTDGTCPCGGGNVGSGCETASGTGGVTVTVLSQSTQPNGAILVGQGYPSMGSPTAVVIRAPSIDPASPVVFGDGVRCISTDGLVRIAATVAVGGVSTHLVGHNPSAGPGTFYYQLWFRDTPSTYCDPSTAFNLSSGRTLVW